MGLKNIEIYALGAKGGRLKYYPNYFDKGEEFDWMPWDFRKDDAEFRRRESEFLNDNYEYTDGHLSYQFVQKIAYDMQRLSLHPPSKLYYYKVPNDGSLQWHQEYGIYEMCLCHMSEAKRIALVPVLREEISELSDKSFLSEMKSKYREITDMNQALCYAILDKFIDEHIADVKPVYDWENARGYVRALKQELDECVALGDPTELSYFDTVNDVAR